MEYTTRIGDLPTQAHINYECPCGCTGGVMYERGSGAMHLGECCCGRLLWVGPGAEGKVQSAFANGVTYLLDFAKVTLLWGDTDDAVLAVPAGQLPGDLRDVSMAARVRDVVCNMYIDPSEAAATSERDGVTYYFCAVSCKTKFDAEPTKYLKLV